MKEFFGTTENAVKIQLYVAIITYCLVAIAEKRRKIDMDMYDMLRILSISLLGRDNIRDMLIAMPQEEKLQNVTQLSLIFLVDTSDYDYSQINVTWFCYDDSFNRSYSLSKFNIGSVQYCLRLHFLHIEPFHTLSNCSIA